MRIEDPEDDGAGFDVDDWMRLPVFAGRAASLDDVQAGRAVFALGDTIDPQPIEMDLPQPAIWWDDEAAQACIIVQAEIHPRTDDEPMEVAGLILPDGSSAVALLEDVDLVDDSDPTWRDLVARAVEEA